MRHPSAGGVSPTAAPDLGDVVIALLAGTLAGLRDRLASDGFDDAAELVAGLVDAAEDHLTRVPPRRDGGRPRRTGGDWD